MTARVGSFFAHVEQRDFAPFDQGGANGRSGDNAGHGESFWWALMGCTSGPAQPPERFHRLATASVGSSCFARNGYGRAFSGSPLRRCLHFRMKVEERAGLVCATVFN